MPDSLNSLRHIYTHTLLLYISITHNFPLSLLTFTFLSIFFPLSFLRTHAHTLTHYLFLYFLLSLSSPSHKHTFSLVLIYLIHTLFNACIINKSLGYATFLCFKATYVRTVAANSRSDSFYIHDEHAGFVSVSSTFYQQLLRH